MATKKIKKYSHTFKPDAKSISKNLEVDSKINEAVDVIATSLSVAHDLIYKSMIFFLLDGGKFTFSTKNNPKTGTLIITVKK